MRTKAIKSLFASLVLTASVLCVGAQSVSYSGLDGKRHDISSDKGKVVVLAVSASWLPLSEPQIELLGKIGERFGSGDVALYFIATDTIGAGGATDATDAQLADFAKRKNIRATVLRDPRGALTERAFKVDQVPAFIILDKQGNPSGRPITGIQPNRDISPQLIQRIESLL